ncbi:MAG TPA: metalloregulator ArsR/SmtB family transcription factor [Acidimicrobiales bacterium]|nr:metalloregulator ArsR/SmtB family transcription factor [Acidimicrobiales bacterium]
MSIAVGTQRATARWLPRELVGRELMAKFFRALGDPTRLALVEFCAQGERTGTDCVLNSGLSQGRVSAHLGCLVSCGLITVRREGRFAYFQVTDPRVLELLRVSQQKVADQAASIAACTRVGPTR